MGSTERSSARPAIEAATAVKHNSPHLWITGTSIVSAWRSRAGNIFEAGQCAKGIERADYRPRCGCDRGRVGGLWKAMGVGGVRQDFEFQSWLLRLGVRYLTGGSDVGYILSAGRADVKQLRELKL